jgi:hypothetical protein
VLKSGVAVEKLLSAKIAKIKWCQEALQRIFSGCRDIFYPPNLGCLGQKASFSTAAALWVLKKSLNRPFFTCEHAVVGFLVWFD